VFVADDADVMRKAIRSLLSNCEDIAVVGGASNFPEATQKMRELRSDLIILDVNMPHRNHIAPTDIKSLLNARVLAITLGADDVAGELLDSVGAVKVLDKMNLADPTHSGDPGTGAGTIVGAGFSGIHLEIRLFRCLPYHRVSRPLGAVGGSNASTRSSSFGIPSTLAMKSTQLGHRK